MPATTASSAHYSRDDLAGKAVCKRELQREVGLLEDEGGPSWHRPRLVEQKGIDVVLEAVDPISSPAACSWWCWVPAIHRVGAARLAGPPPKPRLFLHGYNEGLAHRIEAGADLFLMSSRFEPCGLNQMYSLRYGTYILVRLPGLGRYGARC